MNSHLLRSALYVPAANAKAVIEAFARPANATRGVIALSGRMVERLHLDMAVAMMTNAAVIAARES
jgi:citrate lyase subunit beta / citryl-CoA lyase